MLEEKKQKKINLSAIVSWCFYDWACSSFSIIVTTFIFATYFTTKVAANQIVGTYQWANATSLAAIIIALVSPLFGAIADRSGHHKWWLFVCTIIAVIFSGLLWFSYPNVSSVFFTLVCVVIATVSYEVAQVFYNSFLPSLAPKRFLGRVSGWGWGTGYLGGIIALAFALFVFIRSNTSWLDATTAEQVRICGPFVALWYMLFALPLFIFVPPIHTNTMSAKNAIRIGFAELVRTIKTLPSEKNILLYLIAHMFYTDGLNTLFAFGGIYAAGTFGLSFEEVLIFGITMNITAGLGALILSWMDDYYGSKKTVLISLVFLIIFGVPLLFLQHKYIFWGVALLLCLFVGPVQSASRSLMVRLFGSNDISAEMFGLYALSGKITAFMGPWLLGTLTFYFDSQRVGMATVLCFFVIGGVLLCFVQEKRSILL